MRNPFWVILAALLCLSCEAPPPDTRAPAPAAPLVQPARADEIAAAAGADFDFYVLSLSWSPTYCLDEGDNADPLQCRDRRPYGFIVHGLWPQREHGRVPECEGNAPLKADLVNGMLDLMPSPGLVRHEWRAHGQCSGLSAEQYFAAVRKARANIRIPEDFAAPARDVRTDPVSVERAFMDVNSGLAREGVAVTCSRKRLREVRICLTKTYAFRACSDVDRRGCTRDAIIAPASRGG